MWPEHCNFVFVVLHMSGYYMYFRGCSYFDLQWCLYYQVETRWMFLSNYLQMMHEQLKNIKQVYWLLEWIFLVDYIFKDDQYPWPWCKLVLRNKKLINEDKWESWTNEKVRFYFDKWSICLKYQKSEKCQTFNFNECSK